MTTATKAPIHAAPTGRKRWRSVLVLALAVVLAGGAVAGWLHFSKRAGDASGSHPILAGDTAERAAKETAVSVETTHLAPGGILRTSTQIGSVQPFEEADLYSKISGYLSELHVDYGDRVKRDQLLAVVDDPEIVKDAEKAEADVRQAKAAVEQAEAFIESAKADRDAAATAIEQAVAEVRRYVSMRVFHQKKFARYQDLVQKAAVQQELADEQEEAYDSARAAEAASEKAVLNTRAQHAATVARVKKAEADRDEAKANVQVAEAKRDKANVIVSYTRITSPYDGVITKRDFFRGAFIRSASDGGSVPLLTVARTDKVRVVTEVPDRNVPFTDVGDDAEITLDALGDEVFKGKVSRFAESEDPMSRTMHTEIDLPNPKNRIHAGMYGIAKIILDLSSKSTTLPASCLVGEAKGGKADVYLVKDGKVRKTRVAIGADDGLRVEILSGIAPQDEVVMDTQSVSDGVPVRIITGATESKDSSKENNKSDERKSP